MYINSLNNENNNDENFDLENMRMLNEGLDELVSNNQLSENNEKEINNISNNEIELDNKDEFLSSLRDEKEELLNSLNEKNLEYERLNEENEQIKNSFMKKEKELLNIKNEYAKLKLELEQLKNKTEHLELIYNKSEKEKKNLKFENIELSQKIESLNSNYKIFEKIQNEESNNSKENVFKVEVLKIQNKYDEATVENSKIQFEKKSLEMRVKNILKEKENEISIINDLHDEEIKKLNKTILNLQEKIKELYQISNQKIVIRQNNSKSNYRLLNKVKEYERKIQKLSNENFDLKKEIAKTYSKCDELNLLNENKDKVIEKLSIDFQDTINKLNNEKQNENILIQNQIDKNEYDNKINFLTNENKKLYKQVENYAQNIQKINSDVNEANKLFSENNQCFKKKVSEYKHKIITLKTKINELYEEIDSLKRNTK